MNDDLISRKALIAEYDRVHIGPPGGARKLMEDAPAVDAVPVVHGRWRARDIIAKQAGYGQRYYNHAECKVNPCGLFKNAYDYCPSCGAKMDGGENNV